jgi:hypothetical protein
MCDARGGLLQLSKTPYLYLPESSVSQSLSHDDSVSSIVAHGAEVGSSRAPHFDGANR